MNTKEYRTQMIACWGATVTGGLGAVARAGIAARARRVAVPRATAWTDAIAVRNAALV